MPGAPEGFDDFIVARVFHQDGGCGIISFAPVELVAAINPAIVEYDDSDWQTVTADGLDFHPAEAERAIALDSHNRAAAHYCRSDGIAHTDAHHTPGTA